jgi:hypothetical protein
LIIALAACASRPSTPPPCCAAPGFSRSQVETVLGAPAPPQSSRWHPFPSPPPNAPIYTTEHGYLTVQYAGTRGLATRFSLDLYEGKGQDDGFRIASAFLPPDAVDTGTRAVGGRKAIRVYTSRSLAARLPASHGLLYVECEGAHPNVACEQVEVVLGSP